MIELLTYAPRKRPDFALIAGTELMVSAAAIGATGMFSPLAGVAPKLDPQALRPLPRAETVRGARARRRRSRRCGNILKKGDVAHLKAALRAMGRDCGAPRPPLLALDAEADHTLAHALESTAAATVGAARVVIFRPLRSSDATSGTGGAKTSSVEIGLAQLARDFGDAQRQANEDDPLTPPSVRRRAPAPAR